MWYSRILNGMTDKVDDEIPMADVVIQPVSQGDALNQSKNVAFKILMLRYSLALILIGLATGLGSSSFLLLHYRETATFHGEFSSATIQTSHKLFGSLSKIYIAANLLNEMYQAELGVDQGALLPNFTLPHFQGLVSNTNKLCNARVTSFSPLITNNTRASWESYATSHVGLLNGPSSLTVSTNGSRIVADGIFQVVKVNNTLVKVKAAQHTPGSEYPNYLFPIWEISPIVNNAIAVMYDPHSDPTRMIAIDKVVSTLSGASTDVVELVVDKEYKPSTILYFPVTNNDIVPKLVGLLGIAFSWDEIFADVLPSYLNRIDCVVSTKTQSFTLALDGGQVYLVGHGDQHDTTFDKYGTVVTYGLSDSAKDLLGYSIILYPTEALYSTYITSYPQNVCVGAVVIIAFTALVFTLYVYLVNIRQSKLEDIATRSLVRDTSRDAVLQSKKIYVRYISHEMRTPLNVAFLGLKILNKDLSRGKNTAHFTFYNLNLFD